MSSSSNTNTNSSRRQMAPKRSKKVKFQRYKRTGVSGQKRTDNKQSSAINNLQKKVYKLEMSKFGQVQQNYHSAASILKPTDKKPIVFDMKDFTCERGEILGGRFWQYDPTVAVNEPFLIQPSNWFRSTALGEHYWGSQNDDQPDGGSYLALDSTYFFEVKGSRALSDTRVRIDIVSQKATASTIGQGSAVAPQSLALPNTLRYLTDLAQPYKNRINPSYFKKYISKVIYINSSKTNPGVKGTTGNTMRFSLKLKHNSVCIQHQTNPQVGGGIIQLEGDPLPPFSEEPELIGGNFGPYNVPIDQPLYCIISTDDSGGTASPDEVQVLVSRRVRWRDALGNSTVA